MQNELKIYAASMGKIFRVRHIATGVEEANEYCEKHSDTGVIAEDKDKGIIFIADLYAMTKPSSILE
jgi:hypothetical protein